MCRNIANGSFDADSTPCSYSSATIPDDADLRRVGKRPLTAKPIAMFRIREDEFLLCYDG